MSFDEHLAASTPIAQQRRRSRSSEHSDSRPKLRISDVAPPEEAEGGLSDWHSGSVDSSSLSSQSRTSNESTGEESDISTIVRELYQPHDDLVSLYRARPAPTNRTHHSQLKEKLSKFIGVIKYLGRLITQEEKRLRTVKNVETRVVYQNRHSILESLLRLWIKMLEVNARKCRSLQEAIAR